MPWALPFVTEFWDARVGISQGTATERVSAWAGRNGFATLSQGTAGNQPLLLPHAGTNYLWNDGVNANYASVPDSAAISVTGDIDIRVDCALDDYTPSVINTFVSKDNNTGGAGSRSYQFYLNTSGQMVADFATDGSSVLNAVASANTGLTDGTRATLRVTRTASTGNVNFYTGTSVSDTAWTQIGTTQATSAGNLFDNALDLFIGAARSTGTNAFNGKLYRVQIRSGSSGTIVLDCDFALVSEGATTFTESSSNGATVTINKTGGKPAFIVGSQKILTDGAAYFLQGTFTNNSPYTVGGVLRPSTWSSGAVFWDGKTANSFALQQITGTPQMRLHDGTLNGATVSPTLGTKYVVTGVQDAAGAASLGLNLAARTSDTLSHTAMAGLTMGADGSGAANFSAGIWDCLFLCNTALSTAQLNQLIYAINSQYWVF